MMSVTMRSAVFAAVALGGLACGTGQALAQSPGAGGSAPKPAEAQTAGEGTVLDRVVAVVNGDVVLESDVDQERRFSAFQPITDPTGGFSRARAVERLINRDLILQQTKLQPQAPVTEKELDDQLMQLRKEIPACKVEHCETDAGWQRYLSEHGFTADELRLRWKQRIEVLRFIEQRFRMGIRISPEEIKSYYDKTLLPQYAKQKVAAPKLSAISERIQEVLLQQQVSSLLVDWLKSLRAQGTVQVIGQDEASTQ